MKKLTALFLTCVMMFGLSACTQNNENTTTSTENNSSFESTTNATIKETRKNCTFRTAIWGDSIEQVKDNEIEQLLDEKEDTVAYIGNICGYESTIIYTFNQNKLFEGGYYISNIYTSAGQYISAYNALKSELNKKYGTPSEDEIINFEQDSLIEMAGASRALEYGYVAYRARWETSTTNIMLGMMSENYEVCIVLNYTDKNYTDESQAEGI